jgi:hypothetical protein
MNVENMDNVNFSSSNNNDDDLTARISALGVPTTPIEPIKKYSALASNPNFIPNTPLFKNKNNNTNNNNQTTSTSNKNKKKTNKRGHIEARSQIESNIDYVLNKLCDYANSDENTKTRLYSHSYKSFVTNKKSERVITVT